MGTTAARASSPSAVRDHGFHRVTVARVVTETADAASLVLDVPEGLRDAFAYEAGQFCTFRVELDGDAHHRCYSMSSAPGVDDELQVTVKRVPGGLVSNWLLDNVSAGDGVDVSLPAGAFRVAAGESALVGFAAGSGITPIISIAKATLAGTDRPVRLLYANRDAGSVIFDGALADLAARHGDRFELVSRLDADDGFLDAAAVATFLGPDGDDGTGYYLCGPAPFMDVVEGGLLAAGVDPSRIHVERFTPAPVIADDEREHQDVAAGDGAIEVTVDLGGKQAATTHHPGTTLLQTARQAGLSPPSSCESGSCATCMARLVEGTARMHVNDALTDDEVADGWVLTCQAVPTSPTVHVVYE